MSTLTQRNIVASPKNGEQSYTKSNEAGAFATSEECAEQK